MGTSILGCESASKRTYLPKHCLTSRAQQVRWWSAQEKECLLSQIVPGPILRRCVRWNCQSPTAMKLSRNELPAIRSGRTVPVHSMAQEQRELQKSAKKFYLSRTTTIKSIYIYGPSIWWPHGLPRNSTRAFPQTKRRWSGGLYWNWGEEWETGRSLMQIQIDTFYDTHPISSFGEDREKRKKTTSNN